MIIGGAEDKLRGRAILKDFVVRSGGPQARIAVVPTASSIGAEVTEVYDSVFRSLGAADVVPVAPESREEAQSPELVARLAHEVRRSSWGGEQRIGQSARSISSSRRTSSSRSRVSCSPASSMRTGAKLRRCQAHGPSLINAS